LPSESTTAQDAAYLYLMSLLARRADHLNPKVVGERVEQAFRDLCSELSPTLSLEVGAHEGSFSTWMKAESPATRCIAFEANPYVHRKYADRHADRGVEYLHMAVSEQNGTVELGIPRQFHNFKTGNRYEKGRRNKMASLATHRYAEETETVEVPSVRLDDFVAVGEDDTVVAWIDVEGASGTVLASGRNVLSRASVVYIEVENEPVWDGQWLDTDVARFLATCGLVPICRDSQRAHQYNVVFASADIAQRRRTAARCDAIYTAPTPRWKRYLRRITG
jgi:FkbM family methyltransferase